MKFYNMEETVWEVNHFLVVTMVTNFFPVEKLKNINIA